MRLFLASALALAASGASADTAYHPLAGGSFSQDWSNTGLISTNDDWSMVPSLEGYRGDNVNVGTGVDPRTVVAFVGSPINVNANVSNASAFQSGGIAEIDSGDDIAGNPTIGFQGSGTADAPFLLLRLNTAGCSAIQLSYTLRDIDTLETTLAQPVVVQGRSGESGNLAEIPGTYVAAANNGSTTPTSVTLPATYENQAVVQLRWLTTNAANVDAMIGIDDILVTGNCGDIAPTVSSTTPANLSTNQSTIGNVSVQFSEPVTTNAGWFGLTCSPGGSIAVTESGTGATRTLDPVADLPASANCTANITAANVIDLDETPTPMASDYSFSFGTDAPPTVISTVPVNAATGVARSSNVAINFSEAVTVTPGWFSMSCTSVGQVIVAESGTGATRTLDPTSDLPFGSHCDVTVNAANVADQDGTIQQMTGNHVFGFDVLADVPPTVTSTTPANNESNVALFSNIAVNFSEPVTVSGSWFSISCAASGAHTAVVSGGPSSYTLNPDVNFSLLEQCTVLLTSALIVDQDGTPDQPVSNYSWAFTSSAGSAAYYQGVNTTSDVTLRATLHPIIDDHIAFPYSIDPPNNCNISAPSPTVCDSWNVLEAADQNPANANEIIDVYQNDNHPKAGQGNANYNREHTWPNSLGFGGQSGLDGNGNPFSPYVDAHMLYLSDIQWNANRDNSPYDNCAGCSNQDPTVANNGVGGQGGSPFPGDSNWWDNNRYQVWAHRKGDMARAVMYMDIRYEGGTHANTQPEPDLILTNNASLIQIGQPYMGILSTLLQWHQDDPPDAQEILRNEVVYGFQGNRNPFIDHPEYAACLFQNQCTAGNNIFGNGFEGN